MHISKRKSFKLLATLDQGEFEELELWLCSPWCNTNKKLIELYTAIKDFYPDFQSDRLNETSLFRILYPKKTFHDKMLRNLFTKLYNTLTLFITTRRLKERKDLRQSQLTQVLYEKGETQNFEGLARKRLSDLSKMEALDWKEHLEILLLAEQLYYHPETSYRQVNQIGPLHLALHTLELFRQYGKLRFKNEFVERQLQLSRDVEKRPDKIFRNLIDRQTPAAFTLYQDRLQKYRSDSISTVIAARDKYYKQYNSLPDKDKTILFFYLLNDLLRLSRKVQDEEQNEAKDRVLRVLFDLYNFGFKEGLLIHDGKITVLSFLNMVSVGNSIMEYEAVNRFVLTYAHLLPTKLEADATSFARAHSLFYQGQFKPCIDFVEEKTIARSISFTYRTRVLKLQAYCEYFLSGKDVYEDLLKFSNAFNNQLTQDQRLNDDAKKDYKKFIYYTEKLVKWVDALSPTYTLEALQEQFRQEKTMHGRSWLKKKFSKLKRGYPQ